MMLIHEAAKLLNVTPETLRRWDKSGKLHVKRHPINNYRIFDDAEINQLKQQLTSQEGVINHE